MNIFDARLTPVINLPYHQFIGINGLYSKDGTGGLSITVNSNNANPKGMLHGGVIYSLCDVSAYAALLGILPESQDAVTHDIHISVLRPASMDQIVKFEAKVLKKGRQLAFMESIARIDQRIIAAAKVTKSVVYLEPLDNVS